MANAQNCNVQLVTYKPYGVNYVCAQIDGKYYGPTGTPLTGNQNISAKTRFKLLCEERYCAVIKEEELSCSMGYGEHYSLGDIKDFSGECEAGKLNFYFDDTGKNVSKQAYESACSEKKYCQYSEGKYYGIAGTELKDNENISAKTQYELECEPKYCGVIKEETLSCTMNFTMHYTVGNKRDVLGECENSKLNFYFNSTGVNVSKQDYEEDCERHYCQIINNKYYGIDGTQTTKEKYESECIDHPKCGIENGKYYDINGQEISKTEYEKQCGKHSCVIIDNTYYDKDGNIVDKATYDKYCPIPENPSTGNFIPLISITILIAGGVGIYFYTKKKNKLI